MEHAADGAGGQTAEVILRIVLLLVTAVVAGCGLLRPAVQAHTRRTLFVASAAAVVAVVDGGLSIPFANVEVAFAVVQMVLTAATPFSLRKPGVAALLGVLLTGLLTAEAAPGTATGLWFAFDVLFAVAAVVAIGAAVYLGTAGTHAWRGGARNARVFAVTAAAVLAVTGLVQLLGSGVAFDRRVYQTGYGLVVLAGTVLAIGALVLVLVRRRDTQRAAAVAVLLSFGAWTGVAAVPAPEPLPSSGAPELTSVGLAGKQVPVLVTPHRPGPNLVHFPSGAGRQLTVTAADGRTVRAERLPGAEGAWARVTLPQGQSSIEVSRGAQHGTVALDAGEGAQLPEAAGADGPECASAALGSLVAGKRATLDACPADRLTARDAADLGTTVGFLAGRGDRAITLDADRSRRSVQAAAVVRRAAARHGVAVSTAPRSDGALLVVSGWRQAATRLTDIRRHQQDRPLYAYGDYLAPWLLNAPIVNSVPTSELPLRFDPRVRRALEFSVALENRFGGENPSTSAYRSWAAATGTDVDDGLQIYGCAQVTAMPSAGMGGMQMGKSYPGQWIPEGTIVPVSRVLR